MSSAEETKSKEYALARANQELFRNAVKCCMEGQVAELEEVVAKVLADCGPGFTTHDVIVGFKSEGKTLLHIAASGGKLDVLKFLLSHVEKLSDWINLPDDRGMTMLINATISESLECMKYLLDHGADVNMRNKDGACAMHFAASDGNISRIALLCSHHANLTFMSQSGSPLHWAAGKGHAEVLKFLLEQEEGLKLVNLPNSSGVPPIIMAAANGSDECVAVLIEHGADVGAVLSGHVTLLHICAEHGLRKSCALLLQNETGKKCVTILTDEGNSPMILAAMSGHRDLIELFLPFDDSFTKPGLTHDQVVEGIVTEASKRLEDYHHAKSQDAKREQERKDAEAKQAEHPGVAETVLRQFDDRVTISDEALAKAEVHKQEGNAHFKGGRYAEAAEAYGEAIKCNKYCAAFYSNRSACYMALKDHQRALVDAEICRRLDPHWVKGCYRLAVARLALNMYEDAALAAFEGCKLDPKNAELKEVMQEAVRLGQEEYRRQQKGSVKQNS